jgi:D-alanine-D-alanine ligase
MKKLRVLALMHAELVPPADISGHDVTQADWKMEYAVVTGLKKLGHEVYPLGIHDDLPSVRKVLEEWKPHIVFNLLEHLHGIPIFDQHVVAYLELSRIRYTGCNPRGLLLARDKALSKKLLTYHRIPTPDFAVFPVGRTVRRPKRLGFPLIVKSLTDEASVGISQSSVVDGDDKLAERVKFIHESNGTHAIAERYIEGRELYVGILGNLRLQVFPVWEMFFKKMPPESWRIATDRVKWSTSYQKKHGIDTDQAKDLPPEVVDQIGRICKRAYRTLDLSGYARLDLRLDSTGKAYVIEANPNPQLASGEDFGHGNRKNTTEACGN